MKITLEFLKKKGACEEGITWFKAQKKVDSKDVLNALITNDKMQWANWLICRLMDKP